MHTDDPQLMSHFEGRFDDIIVFGPVPEGIRMNGHCSGPITAGALAGGHLSGVDYFRIRSDGVGVVDAREVVRLGDRLVSVVVDGYVLPPAGMPQPSAEQMMTPEFSWPDAPFTVQASARFETAAPDLAHLNTTVVSHTGVINFATGELTIQARRVGAPSERIPSGELADATRGV